MQQQKIKTFNLMSEKIDEQLLFDFILDETTEEQSKRIMEKIESDEVVRNQYLQKKREFDIERYLENDLSFSEKIELEELIKKDQELREHFKLSININDFLQLMVIEEQCQNELERMNAFQPT